MIFLFMICLLFLVFIMHEKKIYVFDLSQESAVLFTLQQQAGASACRYSPV